MRSNDEIQRAHDILVAVILDEVKFPIQGPERAGLIAAADVLCWVLLHDHNRTFAKNLRGIESFAAANGYELKKISGKEPR